MTFLFRKTLYYFAVVNYTVLQTDALRPVALLSRLCPALRRDFFIKVLTAVYFRG